MKFPRVNTHLLTASDIGYDVILYTYTSRWSWHHLAQSL